MNTTTQKPFLTCLFVAIFIFAALLTIASPILGPTKIPSNESIFGDCKVQDITLKYDDDHYVDKDVYGSEEYATMLRCEVGLRRFEVLVLHKKEGDRIRIEIHLDIDLKNFTPVLNDSTAPSLMGHISHNNSYFQAVEWGRVINKGESDFEFKAFDDVKVKIDSKESYKPNDILNDLAENGELKFEFETNDHTHEKTVEFDGANDAVKEFRKRIKSLRKTSNENR